MQSLLSSFSSVPTIAYSNTIRRTGGTSYTSEDLRTAPSQAPGAHVVQVTDLFIRAGLPTHPLVSDARRRATSNRLAHCNGEFTAIVRSRMVRNASSSWRRNTMTASRRVDDMSLELQASVDSPSAPGEVGDSVVDRLNSHREPEPFYTSLRPVLFKTPHSTSHPGLGEPTYRKHLADQVGHHLWWTRSPVFIPGIRHRRSLPAPCSSDHTPSLPVFSSAGSPFPSHARTRHGDVVSPDQNLIVQFGTPCRTYRLYVRTSTGLASTWGSRVEGGGCLQEDRALNA